jgi:heme oxygenase
MTSEPLSAALRQATWAVHHEVEALPLVQAIMSGTIDRAVFVRYTGHLLGIYQALEDGLLRHEGHPACAGLLVPGLARVASLQADLDFLGGPVLDSALARRIGEMTVAFPPGLVAYFYLRYFGDLSGGQMLAQALRPLLLGPQAADPSAPAIPAGLSFYDFSTLGPVGPAKQLLRSRLDAVTLSATDRQAVLDEAVGGFQEHAQLFRSLL